MNHDSDTPSTLFHLDLNGEIGKQTVEDIVLRIRAAIRNGRHDIVLRLSPECRISSAEFLAFLAATRDHLATAGGSLRIVGAKGQTRELLFIAQLHNILDESAAGGGA